jgi:hypothetical protein
MTAGGTSSSGESNSSEIKPPIDQRWTPPDRCDGIGSVADLSHPARAV